MNFIYHNVKTNYKMKKEVISMTNEKSKPLNGEGNKRLKAHRPVNNEYTAAWAGTKELKDNSNVSIPSLNNVEEAKDWVDNGSKL